ncbi:protein zwilch homolog [Haliotis rubra]|uniref:protein zwilch homolog n=1 Tax=Haliotis rubra TaxID=36100 RepID=UPI001EE566C2|nr:protein zwilch homolog [Haliotis rubra]
MNPSTISKFVDIFRNILQNKTSQEYDSSVVFEFQPKGKLSTNSVLDHAMTYYLDISCDRSSIVAYKGRLSDINNTKSVDISQDVSISRKSSQSQSTTVTPKRKKESTGSTNGKENSLDLDGSPLKLQAYVDLSSFDSPSSVSSPKYINQVCKKERRDFGISNQKARCLLSMFSTYFTNNHTNNGNENIDLIPDFWVLCDGSDIKSTIIRGVQPVHVDGKTGLRISSVTQSDKDIDLKREIVFDSSSVLSDTSCYARYNVTDSVSDEMVGYQGSLAVDMEWARSTLLLQKPPSHAAAFIKASVTAGDMRSPAYSFYEELTLLKSFVSSVTTGDINWIGEVSDVPLIESVKKLIEQLQQGDRVVQEENEDDSVDVISSLENLVFREHKDLDFTDHLWKVLISCSSFSDLESSLKYIFNCLSSGSVQPMVHNNNHTTMAQLVRDSYVGRMMVPPLKGITPIILLAEMGVEKLKRDYINTFLSSDMTTLSHLTNMVSMSKSLEENLEKLEKLQNVLEMVSMLKLFLSLPHSSLGSAARQMLKHYEMSAIDQKHVFEFGVPTSSVQSVMDRCSPCEWKARFDHTIGSVTESTIYCLTSTEPFRHVKRGDEADISQTDTMLETESQFLLKKQDFVTLF